jgi:hypothetical protein
MPYADFKLESVEALLSLTIRPGELFPAIEPLPVPLWVVDHLARGREAAPLVSEKARSEFLVVPILLAVREAYAKPMAIFSGQRLDVEPSLGLIGECDFILALTSPIPRLKSPLVTILVAKKGGIEAGLGQCIAQAVAARLFNERAGELERPMFGCVTSGDDWQFFRLSGSDVTLDTTRFYLDQVGTILAALRSILVGADPDREHP